MKELAMEAISRPPCSSNPVRSRWFRQIDYSPQIKVSLFNPVGFKNSRPKKSNADNRSALLAHTSSN
jgi:hypothetical protein